VARAVYARAGLGSCEIDELAAQMDQTVSGSFRLKTAAARHFGLVEKDGRSGYRLSPLGQRLVREDTEAEARADAFLNAPLYKAIFEKYRGHLLPPTRALEREMSALGVAPKQADKARRGFFRSARQAGFFAQGEDRLVQPRFDRQPDTKRTDEDRAIDDGRREFGGGGTGGSGNGVQSRVSRPKLIEALYESLPADGKTWTLQEAEDWLQAAAYNFRYAYKLPGVLKVQITAVQRDESSAG
jgi:hypothetical protein